MYCINTCVGLIKYIYFELMSRFVIPHVCMQGINFNPNRLVVATKKPHVIIDFAGKHGKQHEMQEVLFRAYFAEGRNVSSDQILKELVEEVGLDSDKAIDALRDSEYVSAFEKGIKETFTKGIINLFCLKGNYLPKYKVNMVLISNKPLINVYTPYFTFCRYHWSTIF